MKLLTSVLALALGTGCIVGEDAADDDSASLQAGGSQMYQRVVLGRLYQTERWMLPAADTYEPAKYATVTERRIHYVCDAIVKLAPTYVSGLVRLSWDTPISDEMQAIFRGVKQCVRDGVKHPVVFDVVLNAKHFTDPRAENVADRVPSLAAGKARVHDVLKRANAALDPDIYFFDFYTVPFNDKSQAWFTGAMREAIDAIHRSKRLVGGNVWGRRVPEGSDFAALPLTGGFPDTMDQITALESDLPTFVHVRNDPQVCDSEGVEWFTEWHADRRLDAMERAASRQQDLNVGYMYPLFFPLSPTPDCVKPGQDPTQVAYDGAADGVVNRMRTLMDRYQYRPRAH